MFSVSRISPLHPAPLARNLQLENGLATRRPAMGGTPMAALVAKAHAIAGPMGVQPPHRQSLHSVMDAAFPHPAEEQTHAARLAGILHRSVQIGDIESVRTALAHGAPIETADAWGQTPLMVAIVSRNVWMVQALLQANASSNARTGDGRTPVMLAAQMGNAELIRMLAHWNADVNATDSTGFSALIFAASNGSVDAVHALIDANANINAQPPGSQMTALFLAAGNGQAEVVNALARRGAHLHADAGRGLSALMIAALNNHPEVVAVLRDAGADIDSHLAVAMNLRCADLVAVLLRFGANANVATSDGTSLLMSAASWGRVDLLNVLLQAGAHFDTVDQNQQSAAMLAAGNGHLPVVEALRRAGADLDIELEWAAQIGTPAMIETLRRAGARMNPVNGAGLAAAGGAIEPEQPEAHRLPQAAGAAAGDPMVAAATRDVQVQVGPLPSGGESILDAAVASWSGEASLVSRRESASSLFQMTDSNDPIGDVSLREDEQQWSARPHMFLWG